MTNEITVSIEKIERAVENGAGRFARKGRFPKRQTTNEGDSLIVPAWLANAFPRNGIRL